jgi:hypothetical protein
MRLVSLEQGEKLRGQQLSKPETLGQLGGDRRDALLRGGGQRCFWLGVRVAYDDPEARAVNFVVAGTDRAGKLREFERERGGMREIEIRVLGRVGLKRRMDEEIHQDAAGIIHEIAKALRNENGINVARRWLVELEQVVIGQRR